VMPLIVSVTMAAWPNRRTRSEVARRTVERFDSPTLSSAQIDTKQYWGSCQGAPQTFEVRKIFIEVTLKYNPLDFLSVRRV
jgi:hypothetical protein